MVTVRVSDKPLLEQDAKAYVFLFDEHADFDKDIKQVEQLLPGLKSIITEQNFKGKISDTLVVPFIMDGGSVHHIILAGMGKQDEDGHIPIEQYRRAIGKIVKTLQKHKCTSALLKLPQASRFGVTPSYLGTQTSCIARMASYHFDEFITDPSRKEGDIDIIINVVSDDDTSKLCDGLEIGDVYAHSVNTARYWVDLPPCNLTPVGLAEHAKTIAKTHGLTITVFDETEVTQMGMGGLSAVSRGSQCDCQFVVLEYQVDKNAPTIGLVGKGITFDSGGLSLKPASAMETMKEDMAGAAAVLAAMHAIAVFKPNVNVVAFAPLAENLPSDKATKPGDIVRFYNGKTAEIKNTDAEGRLILADALAYAVKHFDLEALIDVATLTGACMYALGRFYSGLFSNHHVLVDKIYGASCSSGDKVWRLPLDPDYKAAIKSNVADISNIGSKQYLAGSITAAWFLSNFVDDVPWAHIDIAGTAYDVPDISYYGKGATGAPVRLLIDLVMNWQK